MRFLAGIEADPDQPGATMLPQAAAANRPIFYAGDGRMRSLGEIRDLFAAKLGAGGSPPVLPAPADRRWHTEASSFSGTAGGGRPPLQITAIPPVPQPLDRQGGVVGQRVAVSVGLGGRRII